MLHAVGEEAVLLAHDLGRDLEDGRGALVEALDQPVGGRRQSRGRSCVLGARRRCVTLRVVAAVDQHARQGVGVELDEPAAVGRGAHETSGTTGCDRLRAEVRPGLGLSRLISATISARSSSSTPHGARAARRSRARRGDRDCRAARCIAGSSRSRSLSWSARHSASVAGEDAGGSKRCSAGEHALDLPPAARRAARRRRRARPAGSRPRRPCRSR